MTIHQARMESLYLQVCSDYFPDWLAAPDWKIVVDEDAWSHGYDFPFPCTCWADAETRQFEFNQASILTSSEWMSAEIIYLICFAQICDVAKEGHGPEWQSLMVRAADRAAEAGDTFVARILRYRLAFARREREETRQRLRANAGKPFDAKILNRQDDELERLDKEFDELMAMDEKRNG